MGPCLRKCIGTQHTDTWMPLCTNIEPRNSCVLSTLICIENNSSDKANLQTGPAHLRRTFKGNGHILPCRSTEHSRPGDNQRRHSKRKHICTIWTESIQPLWQNINMVQYKIIFLPLPKTLQVFSSQSRTTWI